MRLASVFSAHAARGTRHATLIFALASSLCIAAEANQISNGSFETASEKDAALPKGWTPHVGGKVACAWATEGARSGARCLEMAADPAEKWGHAYWTSDPIPVKPCMAYRVTFHFKSKGWGVPCFSLAGVKEWRLSADDTAGKWVEQTDVVVVPPKVTQTSFFVNNYHRQGKTMWLDDVSLVELPLSESPLAKRLDRAKRSAAALDRSLRRLRLSLEQEEELIALRKSLADAVAAFGKLARGGVPRAGERSGNEDFKAMSTALDAVEKAIGGYLFTVWAISPEDWLRGRNGPAEATRRAEAALTAAPDGTASQLLGLMSLVDEGLPVRVVLAAGPLASSRHPQARDWRGAASWRAARLLVTPAARTWAADGSGLAWGEVGPLGGVFLPPGQPRFLQLELRPAKAKPGLYTFRLAIEGLDRTAESGQIEVKLRVP